MVKKSDRRKKQPFLYLGFFIIIWWLIPNSVKLFTKSTFREFQAPIWEISSRVDDLTDYWGHLSDSKLTLIEKGKEFARIKSDVDIQKSRVDEFEHEITRLKTLKNSIESLNSSINLDPSIQYNSILARVSVRKMSGWWQQITIRKGQNYAIKPGNGVVFNGGVLGRVRNVDSRSSEIEIITNPNFRIVAHFAKDKRPVTYQGNGIDTGGRAHGLVTDVPHDIIPTIDKPIKLISSSLGGNFPHGIPIGMVYNLEGEKDGLFKTGKVILDSRINQVHEIAILKQRIIPNND